MTEPSKPPVWPAFVGFALTLAAIFAGQILIVLGLIAAHFQKVVRLLHGSGDLAATLLDWMTHGPAMGLSVLLNELLLLGGVFVCARIAGLRPGEALRWTPSKLGPLQIAIGILGILALGQALEGLVGHLDVSSPNLAALHDGATGSLPTFLLLFVPGTIAAGICEESFFRGFMRTVLARRWTRWANILATSLAFGAIHLDLVHAPLAFCLGLYLGWLAERADSIRPTMLIHCVNNAVSFLQARYGELVPDPTGPMAIVISLLVFAGCVLLLREREPAAAVSPG